MSTGTGLPGAAGAGEHAGAAGPRRLLAPPARVPLAPRGRPTISVVIAYYNRADVVAEAVSSALDQTLPADEIVICDDGSQDDLLGALGPLADRVVVVRQENGGPGSALNAAIARAEGEFVAQLDSDDVFLPGRLEAISDAIVARPDIDVVATDAVTELDGTPVSRYGVSNPFEVERQRLEILRRCFFAWPAIRRSRVLEVGGFDDRYYHASDWECFIRLILSGSEVAFVDEPLYRWRLSIGSVTSSGAKTAAEEATFLERTRATHELGSEERAAVDEAIRAIRRRGLLLGAKEALSDGRPDARRRALDLLLARGIALPTRAKAGVAALSPRLARRLLAQSFGEGSIERRFGISQASDGAGHGSVPPPAPEDIER
jgi:Glycosyl transferase family 2